MKRISIISLLVVFITANYAYATFPLEELGKQMGDKQYQEMAQEEIEEICIALLSSTDRMLVDSEPMDWEEFIEKVEKRQDIEPLQEYCTDCFWGVTFLLLIIESVDPLYLILLILFTHPLIIGSCLLCLNSFFPPPIPAPPGEIVSISPNQGEQGTTLTDVTIMGADTTFEDDGVSAILLMPPGGFTVSNINVISNTEIEFDLEIAVDAPVGSKSVIVTYDDGIAYLYNSEVVFEIMEKTN